VNDDVYNKTEAKDSGKEADGAPIAPDIFLDVLLARVLEFLI
jgi:hypothetical protein